MMKSRVQEAKNKHKNGYNCAQAVACTYCDLLGMDEKTAFRAVEAYGLGIAKRYETCAKFSTFELGQKMTKQFEDWNTTCCCALLRGTDGKTDRLRSCRGCVADCARIVEDFLFPGQFEPYEARHAEEE